MPSRVPRVPSCPYHATAIEKMAVKMLGGQYVVQIADLEKMRHYATDSHTRQQLWTDIRATYHLAVTTMQKRPDCPEIMRARPNRVE